MIRDPFGTLGKYKNEFETCRFHGRAFPPFRCTSPRLFSPHLRFTGGVPFLRCAGFWRVLQKACLERAFLHTSMFDGSLHEAFLGPM